MQDAYLTSRWICCDIKGRVEISNEANESGQWYDIQAEKFFLFYGYVIRNSKGKIVDELRYKDTKKYKRNYEIGCVDFSEYGKFPDTVSEQVDTMCRVINGKKWEMFYVEPIMYFMDEYEYFDLW